MIRPSANKQRGVALVMVLLVVALVSVIAVSMGGRLQLQIVRTQNLQEAEQSYWYWQSAEELVKQVLLLELEDSDGVAHLAQNWSTQTAAFPVEGGVIQGNVKDLRSCFNANAMNPDNVSSAQHERRKEQLKALFVALEIDDYAADTMVDSLVDWLDADSMISGTYGAEDPDYEALPYPYRAGNTPLAHITELRLIRGFTREIYRKVKPYMCVIPGNSDGQLNINTIDESQPELLSAMFSGRLDLSQAQDLLAGRPEKGFGDVIDFTGEAVVQGAAESENQGSPLDDFVITSEYFQLRANIRYGDLVQSGTSILQVREGSASVLYRGMGL